MNATIHVTHSGRNKEIWGFEQSEYLVKNSLYSNCSTAGTTLRKNLDETSDRLQCSPNTSDSTANVYCNLGKVNLKCVQTAGMSVPLTITTSAVKILRRNAQLFMGCSNTI
jgi:hypothetical protein